MSEGPGPVRLQSTASMVVIAANPASGRGRATALADQAARELAAAGHGIRRVNTERSDASHWLDGPLEGASALVVVGGDGTVRACAERAAAMGVPIRQLPAGTENLFARQFGQGGSISSVLAALVRRRLLCCDIWRANGEPFILMCSAGFDADVVARVAAFRGRTVSRLTYLGPILQTVWSWRAPRWRLFVEDRWVEEGVYGTIICANCPAYACAMDPIPSADPADGLLDIALLRCTSGIGAMGWMIRLLLNGQRVSARRASSAWMRAMYPFRVQVDGDPVAGAPAETLKITKCPYQLQVLADGAS